MPEDRAADDEPVYRLAELATESGVSERTIRYYQAEKLLPRPGKRGRDAVYGPLHLERLGLIAELRDRGLGLQTIRELLTTDHPARTVAEWLGVDATLSAPWSDDRPRTYAQAELAQLVNAAGEARPGVIGELHDAGFVEPQPDGSWLAPSPALLDHALRLRAAGIDLDISARLRDLLRRRLSSAVDDSVTLLVERAGTGFAGTVTPDELAVAIGTLRPVAREMTGLILAQEVERALASLVESGPRSMRSRRR